MEICILLFPGKVVIPDYFILQAWKNYEFNTHFAFGMKAKEFPRSLNAWVNTLIS